MSIRGVVTQGPLATAAEYWRKDQDTITYSHMIRGRGENLQQTIGVVAGEVRYWVVFFEDYLSGRAVFHIKRNDFPEDISNSSHELEMADLRSPCNTVLQGEFEYPKDVNVFFVDNEIAGEYGFEVSNTYGNDDVIMQILEKPIAYEFSMWPFSNEHAIRPGRTLTYVPNLKDSRTHYFVQIRLARTSSSGNSNWFHGTTTRFIFKYWKK